MFWLALAISLTFSLSLYFFKPRVAQRVGRRKGFRGGDGKQTGGVTWSKSVGGRLLRAEARNPCALGAAVHFIWGLHLITQSQSLSFTPSCTMRGSYCHVNRSLSELFNNRGNSDRQSILVTIQSATEVCLYYVRWLKKEPIRGRK